MKQLYQLSTQIILISFLLVACSKVGLPATLATTSSELTASTTVITSPTIQSLTPSTHVSTPTTSISSHPTPSPASIATPWYAGSPSVTTRLYFLSTDGYGFFDFSKVYPDYEMIMAPSQQQTLIPFPSSPENVGDASSLAFSHFSEQIAYWLPYSDGTGELWLADLDNRDSQLIIRDVLDHYGHQPTILWTPNDKYIILHPVETSWPDMIYSLATGQLEVWPWDCDRIALSSQSGQLALWCSSIDSASEFAVIEWNGDIWYAEQPPMYILVHRQPNSLVSWGWSRSGDKVAYYDPLDDTGALHIVNSSGDLLWQGLAGVAWYSEFDAWRFHPLYYHLRPFQWSFHGSRLLLYGNRTHNVIDSPDISTQVTKPTYHVFDMESGQILWRIEDSAIDLLRRENSERDIMEYDISTAVLSPDGSQVALQAASFVDGDRFMSIIDIDEGGAIPLKPWFDSVLYWTRIKP